MITVAHHCILTRNVSPIAVFNVPNDDIILGSRAKKEWVLPFTKSQGRYAFVVTNKAQGLFGAQDGLAFERNAL